ncbi:hypothetical protein Dvina_29370 [Dactylosporangium vinaceum]|uniref:Uncharacterized protein n=1 Tax=Dactylosporangium vinaceum TaxID=53362 RepID=A0ABV5MEA6_9ACTN|nr:hypothetical protein [Dactylosporangium vinaceum]UAB92458.1 hypothetical protein Dvina_29370 [Dactylosporangium vinaceum]
MAAYEFGFLRFFSQRSSDSGVTWTFSTDGAQKRNVWMLITATDAVVAGVHDPEAAVRDPLYGHRKLAEALNTLGADGWTPVVEEGGRGNSAARYLMRRPR